MTTDVLVIGYGNELRGDDGVGPRVARELSPRLGVSFGVSAIDVHQLMPELAGAAGGRTEAVDSSSTPEFGRQQRRRALPSRCRSAHAFHGEASLGPYQATPLLAVLES